LYAFLKRSSTRSIDDDVENVSLHRLLVVERWTHKVDPKASVQALRIENYIKPVTSFHHAMEEKTIKTDDLAKLILDEFTASSREEELAFFMEKFNLNLDTLEIMPALKEHLEELMSEE